MEFINELKEFKKGFKIMFKELTNKETAKKQLANILTFSRLVISFIIPILATTCLVAPSPLIYILSLSIVSLGALTDFFDGKIARKYNSISTFGKHLDIISDKTFSLMLGISLSILNPIFLINLFGEIIITITNIIYKVKNPYLKNDSIFIGKIKQWPLSITMSLGFLSFLVPNLNTITNIFIILTSIFQIATLGGYINTNNKQIKEHNKQISISNNPLENNHKKDEQNILLKEEYIDLKNVLNEVVKNKNNEPKNNEIKTKKRKK